MTKKTAILIISGTSKQAGLAVGSSIVGSGEMGKADLTVTDFKHQTDFEDKPIVLGVEMQRGGNYFDDAHPITSISYNNHRSRADVTTCTFTS
jgi:hypothetical protein